MEKYARVLVIIFFLCLINLGLNVYLLSQLDKQSLSLGDKPVAESVPVQQTVVTKSPQPIATTTPNIQTDLTQIKAEIRSLRDSLESTGLILTTPEP